MRFLRLIDNFQIAQLNRCSCCENKSRRLNVSSPCDIAHGFTIAPLEAVLVMRIYSCQTVLPFVY